MRDAFTRILSRAKYAAIGGAIGGAVGGVFSRNAASTGAALGALLGAAIGEKRVDAVSYISEIKERKSEIPSLANE